MRTRSRGKIYASQDVQPGAYNFTHYPAGDTGTSTIASRQSTPTIFDSEFMTDVIGNRNGGNSVRHCKEQVTLFAPSGSGYRTYSYAGRGWYDYPTWGQEWYIDAAYAVSSLLWSQMASQNTPPCIDLALPSLDETKITNDLEGSIQKLIVEQGQNVAEIDQLPESIRGLCRYKDPAAKNWQRWLNAMKGLRGTAKFWSSAYLSYMFGIAPLISDIRKTQASIGSIRQWLEKSKNRAAVSARRNYAVFAHCNNSGVLDIQTHGFHVWTTRLEWIPSNLESMTRYVMNCQPNALYFTPGFRNLDKVMKRFFGTPAQIAWELTPWSFVVDWFFDLRSGLRELDKVMGTNQFHQLSYTKSVKWKGKLRVWSTVRESDTGTVIQPEYLCAEIDWSYYERSLVQPAFTLGELNPRFGKTQVALSLALLTQKILGTKW